MSAAREPRAIRDKRCPFTAVRDPIHGARMLVLARLALRNTRVGLVAVLAVAFTACSSDDDGTESASLDSRPAPEMPSAPPEMPSAPPPADPAPAPSATETTEGNPMTAGPVMGEAPASGIQEPSPGEQPAAADAGVPADAPPPACARELTDANKATVTAAIDELFVQGDISAVDRYWGEPYLQHNPIAASGVTAFRNLFGGLISPGNSIYDLSRVVGECELVLIHGDYTSFGGPTFDMFRVDAGRIVEHWDAFALGAGPNPSGHTALDGPSSVDDVELTSQNEALVLAFVQDVLVPQRFDGIADFMSPTLIEHNPQSQDGSAAYVQYLQSQAITYRQVHHDIADGNFVFVLSEGAAGATDVALYDLFRVDAGLIVEHWDGRRDVPTTPTASGLGIF
jgi:predicted SnoaL-like aldol condensation-catalyzing enzyme